MIGSLKSIATIAVVGLSVLVVTTARAETYVVEVHDLPMNYGCPLDFGAVFSGITEVTIRAVGVGGRVYYSCLDPTNDGWYDLQLTVRVGNSFIDIPVRYQVGYDVTAVAGVVGSGEGLCEGDAACFMYASCRPSGLSDPFCWMSDQEGLTISRVVVAITADIVTPVENSSWGLVKAMYRGAAEE